ncbi:MAG: response regulator [Bacteroidia bacterium]|nr:response regulator [Bacteroidia bacterium]
MDTKILDPIDMADHSPPIESNKVLLIEDNPGDARLVEILLQESDVVDCRIINKTTLQEGIEELKKHSDYSAVLLDLSLPDSFGIDTLENLIAQFPSINIIVLTGVSDKNLGIEAVKSGAQDFLIKGAFDAELLAKSIRFSIERSRIIERLEETQNIAKIGHWEYDTSTRSINVSQEIFSHLGTSLSRQRLSQENIEDPQSYLHFIHKIHMQTTINGIHAEDLTIQTETGTKNFYASCKMNVHPDGSQIFSGILQDITERQKAQQELSRSQERYQEIFTKSKDAILIVGFDGKMIDSNKASIDIFGVDQDQLKIRNIDQFLSEDALDHIADRLKNSGQLKDYEIEVTQPGGEIRYCVLNANLISDDALDGYNAIIRDITEHKQAEELRKARDVARQSALMKEKFVASVSHEMRTPMNAIYGMSNLLIKTETTPEQYDYIKSIKQSSELLLGIVNDILEISTLQNGKIEFANEDFDLRELLNNLVNVMRYKLEEKNLKFELNIDQTIPRVLKGDKLRLNQILYNLVGNAIKFTDEGFVRVNVNNLSDNQEILFLKFAVEDTGIGISEDKIEAVFDTFTRVRTKDRIYEGTGLGLSIAKSLVEQQGGKIGATSTLGEGSTFYFDLILEVGDQSYVYDSGETSNEHSVADDSPIKLLLVEDHKMNQLVAKKTLEKQWPDIELIIANNGQEAIEILKEKSFDLILMDIQMPVMDGYEATKHIRDNMDSAVNSIPVLAMTAHAHIAKDEKFKEHGFDDYVLKPFEPQQLFGKIVKYARRTIYTP